MFLDLASLVEHIIPCGRRKGETMAFRISCPECQAGLQLREDPAGKKVKCPRCAHRFQVPESLPESAGEEEVSDARKARPSEDVPPSKKRRAPEPDPEAADEEEPDAAPGKARNRKASSARKKDRAPEPEPEPEPDEDADADAEAPDEEEPGEPAPKRRKRKRPSDRRKGPLPDPDHYPRFQNGITLLGCTWRVLITDKHLLVFPIISGLLFVVVLAVFVVPLVTLVDWTQQVAANNGRKPLWLYPFGFGLAFALHFVKTFCKMALVQCALLRFTGSESSVGAGFGGAFIRIPQVFTWALVSATLGLILNVIEAIHKKIGEAVREIVGAAWGTLTYFVVPIMMAKGNFPFPAIGRSVTLLCEVWGKANENNLGLRYVLRLLLIPVVLLLLAGLYFWWKTGVWLCILPGVIALLLHMAIGAALDMILSTALYRYAATGKVPRPFDPDLMAVAFAPKMSASDRRFRFEAEAARWRGR
jgi:predicted Zn finger-like uncharacterized protein